MKNADVISPKVTIMNFLSTKTKNQGSDMTKCDVVANELVLGD
jgi:hypothetical protein